MQIGNVFSGCKSSNQQFNEQDDVRENHIGYALVGAFIAGTLLQGGPISFSTRFSCDLARIQYGIIGGIAGAIIGGLTEKGRAHSMIAATVYAGFGVGIGSVLGPISVIGYKPYLIPMLGGVAGLVVAEMEPKINKIVNLLLFKK